ncbi:MAG TPA: glycosyltransferase family 2 protein [Puia sp.]|jgi:cellulose synthase/poly-beta-1,6-N-acetylglucosamine synthase-like glycosyltransferase|nr:glycosyltransferase family 2 protein [Puia sp.]
MQFWQYIFFTSCVLVFYNYGGYAILAGLLNAFMRTRDRPDPNSPATPKISFIVAAFNEGAIIREKILNSLDQDYPADSLEFLFITDGSTDDTPGIISAYPSIRLLHEPQRRGKSAAINRAVHAATGDILIFSDANTMLNKEAVRLIARHYRDPKVGGVAGEKKVLSGAASDAGTPGAGEGLYWKYESRLKQIDSDFYSVVGAAGELFSLRKGLYEPLPHNIILDDFILSLRAAQKGSRIIYERDAYATEMPSFSLRDEKKRKVRIAAGGFQSIVMLWPLLLFWRHPRLTFLYVSHRVLRWTLSPLCLILALVANVILFFTTDSQLFTLTLAAQLAFYGLAILSLIPVLAAGRLGKLCKIPYYFVFMNVSVILGFFRWLKGGQSAVWEKARRAEAGIAK